MAKTNLIYEDELLAVEDYPNASLKTEINDYEEWKVVPQFEKQRSHDGSYNTVCIGFKRMEGTRALRVTRTSAYHAGVLNSQSENSGTRLIKIPFRK